MNMKEVQAMAQSQLESYLADEVKHLKGVYYPVRAGFFRRLFIRSLPCAKLHPNPDDEFCFPDIGPNYGIISRYEREFRTLAGEAKSPFVEKGAFEPLEVERIHPDGYMILNGHHRWAAARRVGVKKLPVHILDLTQESDIRKMLNASGFDRRITLDLDEVVFRPEDDPFLEKPLRFPLRRLFPERLRLGIPALFSKLNAGGYDIWIYTAKYYSLEYLRHYFIHYHVPVSGIVTGTARKTPAGEAVRKQLETMAASRYKSTVHIDSKAVVRTFAGSRSFDEFRLSGEAGTWSGEVMDAFEKMRKQEFSK